MGRRGGPGVIEQGTLKNQIEEADSDCWPARSVR